MANRQNGEFQSEWSGEMEQELAGLPEAGYEDEMASALEGLPEDEFVSEAGPEGQQFLGKAFRRIARGVGGFVRQAAPILRNVARIAVPMVATAVGGPLGGILGKVAGSALGEGTYEDEFGLGEEEFGLGEDELALGEILGEDELSQPEVMPELQTETLEQGEFPEWGELPEHGEVSGEGGHAELLPEFHEGHPEVSHEIMAELLAEVAAGAETDTEAEAMIGAAAVTVLSARDRAVLRRVLPNLVRGVAVLTRILRRRKITRPAVRAVPTIVRQTVRTLRQQAASGKPVTRRVAGRVMGLQTQRVLASPRVCARVIQRNVRASTRAKAGRARPVAG
jgi:hypothetical protein